VSDWDVLALTGATRTTGIFGESAGMDLDIHTLEKSRLTGLDPSTVIYLLPSAVARSNKSSIRMGGQIGYKGWLQYSVAKLSCTEVVCAGRPNNGSVIQMAQGTIKRLTDKGFGLIAADDGEDLFFHMTACEGCRIDELTEGQRVSFNISEGPKGPQAQNVRVI
jgi:CspA family cold shock protein